jgi:SAM-dependent methyltransferase
MRRINHLSMKGDPAVMPKTFPFNAHHGRYETWFTHHRAVYLSELLALRALVPWQGVGVEIGAGTGRFSAPLGFKVGVDPSRAMLAYAVNRGISSVQGAGEALPFKTDTFDYVLIVTTICFVDDPNAMLIEARRVLKPGAVVIIGFIDRTSTLGRNYLAQQADNVFYRDATFFSASEVEKLLSETGFSNQLWGQTVSKPLNEIREIEPFVAGRGRGSFVAVRATKS